MKTLSVAEHCSEKFMEKNIVEKIRESAEFSSVIRSFHGNLCNNLTKPFTTVGADPIYAQISGPRPPNFFQANLKLAKTKWNFTRL
jgi:hypothetical protein